MCRGFRVKKEAGGGRCGVTVVVAETCGAGEGGVAMGGEEVDFGVGPAGADGREGGEGEDEVAEGTASGGENPARGHGVGAAGCCCFRAARTAWAMAETTGTATELPNWR